LLRVQCYFDDISGSDWGALNDSSANNIGESLAIGELNLTSTYRTTASRVPPNRTC